MREDRGHNGIHKMLPPKDGNPFGTLVYDDQCRACREEVKPEVPASLHRGLDDDKHGRVSKVNLEAL